MPYPKLCERLKPADKPRRVWRPTEKHVCAWVLVIAFGYLGLHVLAWRFGWTWWPPGW